MANIDLGWTVEGQMTPEESVSAVLKVIPSKNLEDSGTFWTWENKVCRPFSVHLGDLSQVVSAYTLSTDSRIRGRMGCPLSDRFTTAEACSADTVPDRSGGRKGARQ
jgi:hypothetical protein